MVGEVREGRIMDRENERPFSPNVQVQHFLRAVAFLQRRMISAVRLRNRSNLLFALNLYKNG